MSDEPDALIENVMDAIYAVESRHHFHGDVCLCGFSSSASRLRTAHIVRAVIGELLGSEVLAELNERMPA